MSVPRDMDALINAAKWWFTGAKDLEEALRDWSHAGAIVMLELKKQRTDPPTLGINVSDGTGTGEHIG